MIQNSMADKSLYVKTEKKSRLVEEIVVIIVVKAVMRKADVVTLETCHGMSLGKTSKTICVKQVMLFLRK